MTVFAELAASTHYSFLRGASSPADMVLQAMALGMTGIGIADRNSVAGVVRAHAALRRAHEDAAEEGLLLPDFKLIVGSRLVFADETPEVIVYPLNRRGWGRLTRLLSTGNLRAEKGDCFLYEADLLEWCSEDWALIILPEAPASGRGTVSQSAAAADGGGAGGGRVFAERPLHHPADGPPPHAAHGEEIFGRLRSRTPRVWLGATMPRSGPDKRYLARLHGLSQATGIPLIATNDPLYATPEQRPLHDILTCIAEKTTIPKAGRLLAANAERFLKPPSEMARLFRDHPEAIAETQKLLGMVDFTLDELSYHYPDEPVPAGWTPQGWLAHLTWTAAHDRHGETLPERLRAKVEEELRLIEKMKYAPYFLTVHDIVKFAQDQGILCQGRGSAANSAVCYLLGITSADPMEHDLLFSRFISEERREPPDIDVDFEHERREEVIQYIYARYGRHRAGIAATVIHYRSRSAIREVGKALGLSEDITSRLSSTVWGSHGGKKPDKRFAETGLDPDNPEIRRLGDLVQQILQFPRHLSQHVGGFVLTQDRLDETVPIHNAAMDDRTFIEWDKNDIDTLGLMKVDILALGMLTCIRKAFDMLESLNILPEAAASGRGTVSQSAAAADGGGAAAGIAALEMPLHHPADGPPPHAAHEEEKWTLQNIPHEDPATYRMLCRGDSIGVFQVESRAQINMLPRLKPREFYDLVIQVAIVRPGPIEGEMVHPYLRRRSGVEKVTLPSPAPPHDPDELKSVLGRTFGVPLFQEQAMKLAIVTADFSPGDANKLRRAMATFRNVGTIHHFEEKMITGMTAKGYERDFAERCYKQIQGFGSYGFPESHAISFARLVYVSSWIKCHHPAVFAAALLNSQPMGFYAPAQLVRDAREHGVEVREPDVNFSDWDNRVEKNILPEASASGRGTVSQSAAASDGGGAGGGRTSAQRPLHHPSDGPPPHASRGEENFLRIGLRQIDGFREAWADQIRAARPFRTIEELAHKADLPARALRLLADADACRSLGLDRRQALWEVRRTPVNTLPLFEAAQAKELGREQDAHLPAMTKGEHVVADYQSVRLSLKGHPMEFLRERLRELGVLSCAELAKAKNGSQAKVAGVVLIRQRPGKGNAVFITLEDESGVANLLLWASRFEKMRRPVMAARLMLATGEVQRSVEGVTHLMTTRVEDYSFMLDDISDRDRPDMPLSRADEVKRPIYRNEDRWAARQEEQATGPQPAYPRHGHPRNVRILPKSRDFH
ncbi:DNA polymerase III subunit alpha [Parasphingorhabdus flavimaris]|uniref:Error-prone DNA polymerase n=1 Tax=Parasphingorhabdus flavimaris TaxID=266812 RepID=A0ABX2N359_9SPHN|nr:DNA polymerase III subunit alpha [Parasphingorhabdus flavimaris]NVD28104.1 DNA polymerase III subunit alpha [Parasphingorhabdus flavimaris]